jgi:hypothetical protein
MSAHANRAPAVAAWVLTLLGRPGASHSRGTLPQALPSTPFPVLLEPRPRAEKVLVRLPVEQIPQWSCR